MTDTYHIRRVSKKRAAELRRSGVLGGAVLLDSVNGFLIVEPAGSGLGDGEVLTAQEADYEEVAEQVGMDVLGSPAHVLLLEAAHAVANGGLDFSLRFHSDLLGIMIARASQECTCFPRRELYNSFQSNKGL